MGCYYRTLVAELAMGRYIRVGCYNQGGRALIVNAYGTLRFLRNTKKCQDKVASLEKEVEDTRAKIEGLKVRQREGLVYLVASVFIN